MKRALFVVGLGILFAVGCSKKEEAVTAPTDSAVSALPSTSPSLIATPDSSTVSQAFPVLTKKGHKNHRKVRKHKRGRRHKLSRRHRRHRRHH